MPLWSPLDSARMRTLVMLCGLGTVVGCSEPRYLILPAPTGATPAQVDALLAASPLPDGQNIRSIALWQDMVLSCHLVQVRDREAPHVHARHDLTVTVLRGEGRLFVNGVAHPMRGGDTAVIPRGTPHYFVNDGASPAAAFVTFAPAYDGTDQVPVDH
jgi:mannose-6-phosphate isomerase-like protein (cupin superfamily)